MATKATKAKGVRKHGRRGVSGRPAYRRRTYMLDEETILDSGIIQQGLRASTASEAVRYAIRQMAVLMRYVNDGYCVQIQPAKNGNDAPVLVLDIPASRGL